MTKITHEKLYRLYDNNAVKREVELTPKVRVEEHCPVCKKVMYLSVGQIARGCKGCRREIREHNRKYYKRNGTTS